MSPLASVLVLGLVCWIATAILVDSELFRPLRSWTTRKVFAAEDAAKLARRGRTVFIANGRRQHTVPTKARWRRAFWRKVSYLVNCHLCAGTWIGLAIAVAASGPFGGWAGLVPEGSPAQAVPGGLEGQAVPRASWVSRCGSAPAGSSRSTISRTPG